MTRTWHDKPWVRLILIASMGTGIFLLGVLYLGISKPPDVKTMEVVGGSSGTPGKTVAFRFQAKMAGTGQTGPVRVLSVQFGNRDGVMKAQNGHPAVAVVNVPLASDRAPMLRFKVAATKKERTLAFPFEIKREDSVDPTVEMHRLHKTTRPFRVILIPEGNDLSLGMKMRCFVFVRDPTGEPVSGVSVKIGHSTFPGGSFTGVTDLAGLLAFPIDVKQPSFRFKIALTKGEKKATSVEYLRPVGRRLQLTLNKQVVPVGHQVEVLASSLDESTTLYCDLLHGSQWLWTQVLETRFHKARFTLPALQEGLYSLQCYDHPVEPGLAFATQAVVVSNGDPKRVLRRHVKRLKAWPTISLVSSSTNSAELIPFWLDAIRPSVQAPRVAIDTRLDDLRRRDEHQQSRKGKILLLMALALFLVIAWVADTVLRHMIKSRRKMQAFLEEDLLEKATDEAQQAQGLLNTRGWLMGLVGVGGLVLNAIVILWLLWLAKG